MSRMDNESIFNHYATWNYNKIPNNEGRDLQAHVCRGSLLWLSQKHWGHLTVWSQARTAPRMNWETIGVLQVGAGPVDLSLSPEVRRGKAGSWGAVLAAHTGRWAGNTKRPQRAQTQPAFCFSLPDATVVCPVCDDTSSADPSWSWFDVLITLL